jgi:lipoprotein-anchoring transpeptidase ErfK/SrfK
MDDFLGDVIADQWSAAEGNDDLAVIAAINSQPNGVVRQVTGDTVTLSESGVSLTHGLNWRASNGGLIFEARIIPITAVTTVCYFVGLTDTLATTTLELPATLSTTTITYVADNAVGWLYDTAATTDVFYGVGVKATSGIAFANAVVGSAPVADTAMTLRIEVTSSGAAEFFQDGVSKGTLANAVTSTTQLTPIVAAMARTTSSRTLDVDYIYCQQDR